MTESEFGFGLDLETVNIENLYLKTKTILSSHLQIKTKTLDQSPVTQDQEQDLYITELKCTGDTRS